MPKRGGYANGIQNATLAKIDEAGEKLQNIGSSVENLVIDFLPFTLHHRSGVNFIFQNPKYLNRLPLCMSSSLETTVII